MFCDVLTFPIVSAAQICHTNTHTHTRKPVQVSASNFLHLDELVNVVFTKVVCYLYFELNS